jgi:hypothetical protein
MLKKDEAVYSLPKFLNDFFNEFLRNFLNNDTCFNNEAKQSTRLAQSSLTAYATTERTSGPSGYTDEITQLIAKEKKTADFMPGRLYTNNSKIQMPILSTYGDKANPKKTNPGFDREIHYLVYFVARTQPTERMNGLRGEDHDLGIWHYEIGRPEGILKTIDLTKTDSPGLKELRFEKQGYDGLQQLREMYDAKIQCYADVSAFPGMYIYIDPGGFSPSAKKHGLDLTQYGIGGYYMIIRSEHTFAAGQANTTITAKWVAELDAKASNAITKLNKEGSTAPSPAKCYAGKNKNQTSAREEAGMLSTAAEWYAGTSLGKALGWGI